MTGLVVGDDPLLFLGDQSALSLGSCDDPFDGLLELVHSNDLSAASCSEQRALVEQVGEIGTGKTRRLAGEYFEVDVVSERLAAGVDGEDGLAARQIGAVDDDLAVEPARTEKRWVEDVGTVGAGDHDHTRIDVEPVEFDEQLVERLLTFVVPATKARSTVPADGVDLVDEHDGGGLCFGLFEEVSDPRCANADEHLDEVRTRDREERNACLARDCTGKQRLSGPGRPEQQHPLRDLGAQGPELVRRLQKLLQLGEVLHRLVDRDHQAPAHVEHGRVVTDARAHGRW